MRQPGTILFVLWWIQRFARATSFGGRCSVRLSRRSVRWSEVVWFREITLKSFEGLLVQRQFGVTKFVCCSIWWVSLEWLGPSLGGRRFDKLFLATIWNHFQKLLRCLTSLKCRHSTLKPFDTFKDMDFRNYITKCICSTSLHLSPCEPGDRCSSSGGQTSSRTHSRTSRLVIQVISARQAVDQ